jgi:tetratricopeptide (TPR) repeat protein
MPKPIKKKTAKPIKGEDDVAHILDDVKKTVSQRQSYLLPALVGAVVVIIAIVGFSVYRNQTSAKADLLEYEAYRTYYGLNQKQPLPKPEQLQKALEKFTAAVDLRKSAYSLFYVGCIQYDMGKYDEALKSFKELNERFPDDEQYVPLSYAKMAAASLKKGDKEGALKLFDTLANYRTGAMKDLALAESAKILDSMGKTEEAAKKREELKKLAGALAPAPAAPAPQSEPKKK